MQKALKHNLGNSAILWDRLAEPQNDQYDSMITVEFAHTRGYARTDVGGGDPTFFDGRIALCSAPHSFSLRECIPAPRNHPNVERACDLVRLWPKVYIQCQLLLESVSLFFDTRNPDDNVVGGVCNSVGGFGSGKIASIINNHVGLAEALVHEMAHHKLCILGVQLEDAERIIKNPATQKFKSPIRHDRLRPMTAVLHAQYSFTYVAALDIEIIKAGKEPARDRLIAERQLADKLPKLQFGFNIIRDNADVDSAGIGFFEGYSAWLNRVLEEGYRILDELQIPSKTFIHPLDTNVSTHQQREPMAATQHPDIPDDVSHVVFDNIDMTCTRPRRRNDVKEYDLWDEMLLYFPEKEMAFSLNGSTKAIWKLCNGRQTIMEIGQKVGEQFGFSDDELVLHELFADVRAGVIELAKLGLVELEGAAHV